MNRVLVVRRLGMAGAVVLIAWSVALAPVLIPFALGLLLIAACIEVPSR